MLSKNNCLPVLALVMALVGCQKSEEYFAKVEPPQEIVTNPILDPIVVNGCTDKNAANFNSKANHDDGSCKIPGCTDQAAENYDPRATEKDDSCLFAGCMTPGFKETNLQADLHKDELCKTPLIRGCKNPKYQEYMPNADISDPSLCVTRLYNSRAVNIPILSELINETPAATVNLVVDNSNSMAPSQQLLANGFNNFASYFQGYDLFFNIFSTRDSEFQQAQGIPNGAKWVLKDPLNKNSMFRRLEKAYTGQSLIDFANGLKGDILLGAQQYNEEKGMCALTRLAFEENNPLLRPPMSTEDNKVQIYMIISDENDSSQYYNCYKQYTQAPNGNSYYSVGVLKRIYFTYTQTVNNEPISGAQVANIASQADLDYYNSKSTSPSACDANDQAKLQALGVSNFTNCQVRRLNSSVSFSQIGNIQGLCTNNSFSYNGAQYENIHQFAMSNNSSLNALNYDSSNCSHHQSVTTTFDYFRDNAGSHANMEKVFIDKITARHGRENTIFLPIVYHPSISNCTAQQSQFMQPGNKFIEAMNYMKSSRGGQPGGKSAAYDICGNDYAKFLKDNLGDYIKEVFGRLYKIPATSDELLQSVSIVEQDGSSVVLNPSQYSVTRTDAEISLEILPSISLNKNQIVRVDIKTPQ